MVGPKGGIAPWRPPLNTPLVTIDSLQKDASTLSDSIIVDPYDLPFSHNAARLAYHSAL